MPLENTSAPKVSLWSFLNRMFPFVVIWWVDSVKKSGRTGLKNCWAEEFSNLHNTLSRIDPDVLEQIPQVPVLDVLHLLPSTYACWVLQSTRSKCLTGIQRHLQDICSTGEIPNNFHNALIMALYKNKGNKSSYGNYRSIFIDLI